MTDAEAAAMNAAQISELLAMLAWGVDRMPLLQMPGAPSPDGTNVTAFIEKYESLASAVIGHFPYYCTKEVRETVLMLPAYAYRDSGSRSWPALRAETFNAFRALDSEAFKYSAATSNDCAARSGNMRAIAIPLSTRATWS